MASGSDSPDPGAHGAPWVHVVDDEPGVRSLFVELGRREDLRIAAHATAGAFLAGFSEPTAGCVVLDLNLPDRPGLDVLRELARRGSRVPVVCMSGCARAAEAVRALQLGGVDFLEKPCPVQVVLAAIHRALAADRERRRRTAVETHLQARFAQLTPRERDVLRLVTAGLPNKRIARLLHLSPKTVEVHRAHVMQKTGAGSLAELVRMALAAGFAVAYA